MGHDNPNETHTILALTHPHEIETHTIHTNTILTHTINTNTMITNTHTRSPTLIPRIMLLSGFAACFLLVVLMRPTSPSSQHRSCMTVQKKKNGPDLVAISPNDIVYFHGATYLGWGVKDEDDGISYYHVESEFKPELLSSDNSAESSDDRALDILKDKFNSLSLDTITTVEEIWRDYDKCELNFTHMDDSDKSEPYIGRESDIVLKFRSNKVRECHYFVFGKYYNLLNLAPCRKCNKSGKVPGRMWGKNKCPACKGNGEISHKFTNFEEAKRNASKVDAFIEFVTKEKGVSLSSSNRGDDWVH